MTRVKEKLELMYPAFKVDGNGPAIFINEIRDILELMDNKQAGAYKEDATDKVEEPSHKYNENKII